jgi:hypothetical protein
MHDNRTHLSSLLKPCRGYIDTTGGDHPIWTCMEVRPVGPPLSDLACCDAMLQQTTHGMCGTMNIFLSYIRVRQNYMDMGKTDHYHSGQCSRQIPDNDSTAGINDNGWGCQETLLVRGESVEKILLSCLTSSGFIFVQGVIVSNHVNFKTNCVCRSVDQNR